MNKSKILLADDDPSNLKAIMKYLGDENYNMLYAANGEVAVEITKKEHPDLIIMDWAMPLMNGIEATLKLKNDPTTKRIPVIMASGLMTEPGDLKQALEAGAYDYVAKPFNELELKARVDAALRTSLAFWEVQRKNTQIKDLLQKEREYHERELTMYAVYEHEKNELLTSLRDQIRQIEKSTQENALKELRSVRKQIEQSITNEKSWDGFVTHFENVHPDFIKTLKKEHKDLTPNDLRIASYIKIGMDNKEISRITGLQGGSVRSNINRLKKRMDLAPGESIRDYLLAI